MLSSRSYAQHDGHHDDEKPEEEDDAQKCQQDDGCPVDPQHDGG